MSESSFVLPYFEQPKLHLGPITIHAFGVLVATGILLAFRLIRRRRPGYLPNPNAFREDR
jgi:prolipoprotein diacylglyceryltransferase